jgi:hypothetical protein
VAPQDVVGIEQRLDPRFCPSCLAKLDEPGATFCPSCRRLRLTIAKRLWQRHRMRAEPETRRRVWAARAAQKRAQRARRDGANGEAAHTG